MIKAVTLIPLMMLMMLVAVVVRGQPAQLSHFHHRIDDDPNSAADHQLNDDNLHGTAAAAAATNTVKGTETLPLPPLDGHNRFRRGSQQQQQQQAQDLYIEPPITWSNLRRFICGPANPKCMTDERYIYY